MATGEFAYAMNSNRFMAAPELQDQRFAVLGIPFDGAVTNRPGARFGPAEVRRASLMLCDGIHPLFNVTPLGVLGDGGDMRLPNASALSEVRAIVQAQARRLMTRHHCVFILQAQHAPRLRGHNTGRWRWSISMRIATPGLTILVNHPGTEPGPTRRLPRAWSTPAPACRSACVPRAHAPHVNTCAIRVA